MGETSNKYGSEIWGDISKPTKKNQIHTTNGLIKALGVNRLTNRKNINYEAKYGRLNQN